MIHTLDTERLTAIISASVGEGMAMAAQLLFREGYVIASQRLSAHIESSGALQRPDTDWLHANCAHEEASDG